MPNDPRIVSEVTINELPDLTIEQQQEAVRARITENERAYRSGPHAKPAPAPTSNTYKMAPPPVIPLIPPDNWRHKIDIGDPDARDALDSSLTDAEALAELRKRRPAELEVAETATQALSDGNAARHAALQFDDVQRRASLRSAIQEYGHKHEASQRLTEAVTRAAERVSMAENQLQDYKDLEQQIVDWYASEAINDTGNSLPHDLERKQADRGRIVDLICASRSALSKLQAQAKVASLAITAADTRRSAAAAYIVSAEMDRLAADLAEADSRAHALRQQLSTAAATWLTSPTGTAVLSLSTRARDVLLAERNPLTVDAPFSQAIRQWHARLLGNSEATLEDDAHVSDDAAAA
jgi:hypothetical protein